MNANSAIKNLIGTSHGRDGDKGLASSMAKHWIKLWITACKVSSFNVDSVTKTSLRPCRSLGSTVPLRRPCDSPVQHVVLLVLCRYTIRYDPDAHASQAI